MFPGEPPNATIERIMMETEGGRSLSRAAMEFIRLFEENIGRAPPLLVVKLQEAVDRYPAAWLVKAVEEACLYNKQSWRYMETMLSAGSWSLCGRTTGQVGTGTTTPVGRRGAWGNIRTGGWRPARCRG